MRVFSSRKKLLKLGSKIVKPLSVRALKAELILCNEHKERLLYRFLGFVLFFFSF